MSREYEVTSGSNFIRDIIEEDLKSGKHKKAQLRFPPGPNGFLHIGHATTVCFNFGMAKDREDILCNLRFDDTNPEKEEQRYVDAIQNDINWLGYDFEKNLFFASDSFERLYELAENLIRDGKAYVCKLSGEDVREYRGTLTSPGKNSPGRDNPVEENLDLFRKMRAGEFADGSMSLRAKIDMSSPNMNMRDPIMYRIKKINHQRHGDKWCIYPSYDYTHGQTDSFEGVTHSVCSLEFEDHRPLYNWFVEHLKLAHVPRQIEYARFNLSYTVMSKRKLAELVEQQMVAGWDDPRLPTISGMRKRGYPAVAIRNFCDRIGLSKRENVTDMSILEDEVRNVLNATTKRAMAVIKPIKVVIENYPEGKSEKIEASFHPKNEEFGKRALVFEREIYIEESDFMEEPPKKYFRLSPGKEVRLRYSYVIKCEKVIKDESGKIVEIRATYDPETLGGKTGDGRKIKGIIHWVPVNSSKNIKLNLYDRLFTKENPLEDSSVDFKDFVNSNSLETIDSAWLEPGCDIESGENVQFERLGYYFFDRMEAVPVFNRTVTLRDGWAKVKKT